MLHIHDGCRLFLVLYGFYENIFLLHELDSTPRNDTWTEPRATRAGERSSRQQRDATHMNQSPQEATRAREYQIFLQLQDGSTIPYCTLRPAIGLILQEIYRRTNIALFNQRLTLADRELHTGDNIPPNCTIILGFRSRGGTRSHGIPRPRCPGQRAPNTHSEHGLRTNSTYIHAG